MKVLVTGSAGFIGSALTLKLLERGDTVVGMDNHNYYYDPAFKEARLARHADHPSYTHIRIGLEGRDGIARLFTDLNHNEWSIWQRKQVSVIQFPTPSLTPTPTSTVFSKC